MAQINVNHLTFYYEGGFDNIFEDVSFSIDTNWKLGFIGRNGKGKTTFLNLLMGKYAPDAAADWGYSAYRFYQRVRCSRQIHGCACRKSRPADAEP